jgi:methylmalonyl-CoA mutase
MGVNFEEFHKASKKEWLEKVTQELKGKSFEELLVHQSLEGLSIQPIYNSEDQIHFDWIKSYRNLVNHSSNIPGMPPRLWANVASFHSHDTNTSVLHALENGADALFLNLDGEENLPLLLKNVAPQYIQIFIQSTVPAKSIQHFFEWVENTGVEPQQISGALIWDPLASLLKHQVPLEDLLLQFETIFQYANQFPEFKLMAIDGSLYHNSGANAVQELGFAAASLIEWIDFLSKKSTFSPSEIFNKLIINTSVGADFFMEIAKLKVFKILIHRLAGLYEVELSPQDIFIFASTSLWTKTSWEVQLNMLRNSTEAMSAILGGCHALYTLPHDIAKNNSNEFSKRMALNVSNILKEESYLDKVMDPVAGSYFIEHLIDQLYAEVQQKLVGIEEEGGWLKRYKNHEIQKEIKNTRAVRMENVATNHEVVVGVNKFAVKEEAIEEVNAPLIEEEYQLLPTRLTSPFESTKIKKS